MTSFVLLPPNSTHLCQHLDVAYFRPLKRAWRKVLNQWKGNNRGLLHKSAFPAVLREALEEVGLKSAVNVKAGFMASRIYPFNPDKVCEKIPNLDGSRSSDSSWTDAFTHLKRAHVGALCKGKRMCLPPGKGIHMEDICCSVNKGDTELEGREDMPDGVNNQSAPSEENGNKEYISLGEDEEMQTEGDVSNRPNNETSFAEGNIYTIGDIVLVDRKYNTGNRKFFVGKSIAINDEIKEFSFMRKRVTQKETYFVFPQAVDEASVKKADIVTKVEGRDIR